MQYTIKDGVTQSLLSAFLSCRQRAANILDGWERPSAKASFRFGNLGHGILEDLYLGMAGGLVKSPKMARASVRSSVTKRTDTALVDASSVGESEQIHLDALKAKAVFGQYVKVWAGDADKSWIGVEKTFDVNFRGWRLRGKIDGVYRDKRGGVWVLETKTTSRIDEDVLSDRLSFDFQSLFYMLAVGLSGLVKDGDLRGTLYNIIRVPQLKQKRGESAAGLVRRIEEDVSAREDFYFKRFELGFPSAVRIAFANELETKLSDFAAWCRGEIPTYKNETACVGRWSCEFLRACAAGSMVGYKQTRRLFRELDEEGSTHDQKGKGAPGKEKKVRRRKRRRRIV